MTDRSLLVRSCASLPTVSASRRLWPVVKAREKASPFDPSPRNWASSTLLSSFVVPRKGDARVLDLPPYAGLVVRVVDVARREVLAGREDEALPTTTTLISSPCTFFSRLPDVSLGSAKNVDPTHSRRNQARHQCAWAQRDFRRGCCIDGRSLAASCRWRATSGADIIVTMKIVSAELGEISHFQRSSTRIENAGNDVTQYQFTYSWVYLYHSCD